MLKIYSNRFFQTTLTLSVIQQILVAVSTYMILKSGEALATGNLKLVLSYVIMFFLFIILAYIPGSLSYYYLRKSQNSIWSGYMNSIYKHIGDNPLKNTLQNQKRIHNWLTGESKATIEQYCFYIKDSLDIILNILFNVSTIVYVVGSQIGVSIGISLLVGFLVIWLIKGKLENYANSIQSTKNSLFVLMDAFIDKITYLPNSSRGHLYQELNGSLNKYFHEENQNSFLEAIIPLAITLFAILGVAYSLISNNKLNLSVISVLVVALPRLLQIFQYLYVVIGYIQQFIFLRNKNKNLVEFCSKVESVNPKQLIDFEQIHINKDGLTLLYKQLIDSIYSKDFGLYTISGSNGTGKSTLLKWIKSIFPESILITPDNNRNLGLQNLSSGQNFKQLLDKTLLESKHHIILLDEWNANLDCNVEQDITSKIDLYASQNIIIEVRHK